MAHRADHKGDVVNLNRPFKKGILETKYVQMQPFTGES